jgi:hypothetical protein
MLYCQGVVVGRREWVVLLFFQGSSVDLAWVIEAELSKK